MDKQHFDQLVKGVREMKRHMAGKPVRGVKTTEMPAPDVRTIREAANIGQSQFAELIGVKPTITDYVFVRSTYPSVFASVFGYGLNLPPN